MFCPQCGGRVYDGAAFCNNCGASLAILSAAASSSEAAPPAASPIETTPLAYEPVAEAAPAVEAPPPAYEPQDVAAAPVVQSTPLAYNPQTVSEPPVTVRDNASQHYAAPKKPAQPKKRRAAPKKPTLGAKALTVLLCFLFCLFFLLSSIVGITRSLLNKENIEEFVQEIDLNDVEVEENGRTDTLPEYLYDLFAMQGLLTEREFEELLELEDLRESVAELITGYSEYFLSGKSMRTADAQTVVDELRSLEYTIQRKVNEWYYPDYNYFEKVLNDSIDFDGLEKRALQEVVPVDFELIQFLLSPLCFGILIFLTADFLLLLFIVNRKNICYLLPKLSTVFICLGAFYLLLTLGGLYNRFFPPFQAITLLAPAVSAFNALVGLLAAILLVLGIGGKVVFSLIRKREAKAAAV